MLGNPLQSRKGGVMPCSMRGEEEGGGGGGAGPTEGTLGKFSVSQKSESELKSFFHSFMTDEHELTSVHLCRGSTLYSATFRTDLTCERDQGGQDVCCW